MVSVFALGDQGDVRLEITIGEEVDCVGARHLRDSGGLEGVGWIIIAGKGQ